jgi:putative transposase
LVNRVRHWKEALLILQAKTLRRWHRQGFRLFWRGQSRPRGGRPPWDKEIISWIQRLARAHRLWGAERIHGDLLKWGIRVAHATIQKYVRPVRPQRGPGSTWPTFLQQHTQDIWACDFLPIIDVCFRSGYVCCMMELGSRRVVHFGVTHSPMDEWVAPQPREATPCDPGPRVLIRDRDRRYREACTRVAQDSSLEILKTPYRAPKANAIGERLLGSVRRECLDHVFVLEEWQL